LAKQSLRFNEHRFNFPGRAGQIIIIETLEFAPVGKLRHDRIDGNSAKDINPEVPRGLRQIALAEQFDLLSFSQA
jgi:hypothetical protein